MSAHCLVKPRRLRDWSIPGAMAEVAYPQARKGQDEPREGSAMGFFQESSLILDGQILLQA